MVFVACCLFFVGCRGRSCLLCGVCGALFVACCVLFIDVRCLLFGVCCYSVMFGGVWCRLLVVRVLMSDVCYLSLLVIC